MVEVCEHNWHLVELESINESYIASSTATADIVKSKIRVNRSGIFICNLCGLLEKVIIKLS